jgi:hypothetical protein
VTLPISLFLLLRRPPTEEKAQVTGATPPNLPGVSDLRFLRIVAAGVTISMLATIWSIHLITILTAEGYGVSTAITLGTLVVAPPSSRKSLRQWRIAMVSTDPSSVPLD